MPSARSSSSAPSSSCGLRSSSSAASSSPAALELRLRRAAPAGRRAAPAARRARSRAAPAASACCAGGSSCACPASSWAWPASSCACASCAAGSSCAVPSSIWVRPSSSCCSLVGALLLGLERVDDRRDIGEVLGVRDERADLVLLLVGERGAVGRAEDDRAGRAAELGQLLLQLVDDLARGSARDVEARRQALEADEEADDRERRACTSPGDDDGPGAPRRELAQAVQQFSHGASFQSAPSIIRNGPSR